MSTDVMERTAEIEDVIDRAYSGLFDPAVSTPTAEEVAGAALETFGADALWALGLAQQMVEQQFFDSSAREMIELFETAFGVLFDQVRI